MTEATKDIVQYGMDKRLAVTPEQLELIKKTVAVGATDDELKLFIYDCQRRGVHPLDRKIHFVKRNTKTGKKDHDGKDIYEGRATHQAGIDFLRSKAHGNTLYAGQDPIQFGNTLKDASGNEYPESATMTVYKYTMINERIPITVTIRWKEFYPGESQGFMWRKMPFHMLGKCCEAMSYRTAFPDELGGLYLEEEASAMHQSEIEVTPEKRTSIEDSVQEKKKPDPAAPEETENKSKGNSSPETSASKKEELKSMLSAYCSGDEKKMKEVLTEISFIKKGEKTYKMSKLETIDTVKGTDWIDHCIANLQKKIDEKMADFKPPAGCTHDPNGCEHSVWVDEKTICNGLGGKECPCVSQKTLL
jgi:phage recombination protein Bet